MGRPNTKYNADTQPEAMSTPATTPDHREMAKQRDFLAHQHDELDWDILWTTRSVSVPRSAVAHSAAREQFEARSLPSTCEHARYI